MGFRAALSIALPLLVGSCAPAACGPTSAPTLPSPHGWTLCIDSDGGSVSERIVGGSVISYSFPGTNMSQAAVEAAVVDVRNRYAEWSVNVQLGSCAQDNVSFTIYLIPDRAPEQAIFAANWAGYAYINGWGLIDPPGNNFGFVFTNYIGSDRLGVYVAHEAGHGAGLDHPYGFERNIMSDPDPALGWSDAQKAVLAARFLNPPTGVAVDPQARPNGPSGIEL